MEKTSSAWAVWLLDSWLIGPAHTGSIAWMQRQPGKLVPQKFQNLEEARSITEDIGGTCVPYPEDWTQAPDIRVIGYAIYSTHGVQNGRVDRWVTAANGHVGYWRERANMLANKNQPLLFRDRAYAQEIVDRSPNQGYVIIPYPENWPEYRRKAEPTKVETPPEITKESYEAALRKAVASPPEGVTTLEWQIHLANLLEEDLGKEWQARCTYLAYYVQQGMAMGRNIVLPYRTRLREQEARRYNS